MEPPANGALCAEFILLLVALSICSVLSFLETSITAIKMFKLKEISQDSNKYRLLINTLENNPSRILVTILVAYNLANVIAAILSSHLIEKFTRALNFSEKAGLAISIIITSITILIVDLIPKNLAVKNDKFLKSTLWVTSILYYLFYPVVSILSKITDAITAIIYDKEEKENKSVTSEREIKFLIDYVYDKGLIDTNKTFMLKSIFDLSTRTAKEVMVPETDIVAVNSNSSQDETIEIFKNSQLTRLPVYQNNLDNIIGMLYQKDFFQLICKKDKIYWKEIVRPIIFIPESASLIKILKELREQQMHIAIVLNEFGATAGLISIEDIIEEIVGEIKDEYEPIKEKIIALKSNSWLVDASIQLKELNSYFNIRLETRNSLTLAGFLTEQFQLVPKRGEKFNYKNFYFQIQEASSKRIQQVLIYQNNLPKFTELN